jgi:hypothetical protein
LQLLEILPYSCTYYLLACNYRTTRISPRFKPAIDFDDIAETFVQKHLHRTGAIRVARSLAL